LLRLLAVCAVLHYRLGVDLLRCPGDQGPVDSAALEGGVLMLVAGDIGGTKTWLPLVSRDAGPRNFAERDFDGADDTGLQPIREAFPAKAGAATPRPPVSRRRAR
jgi:hypothetical protein